VHDQTQNANKMLANIIIKFV